MTTIQVASHYIRGGGNSTVNVRSALNTGSNIIEDIRSQVDSVKTQIDDLAKLPFFFVVHDPMTEFAGCVDDVNTEIQNVADSPRIRKNTTSRIAPSWKLLLASSGP